MVIVQRRYVSEESVTRCPACKGRQLVPDGLEMISHSPITQVSSSKTTQRFQIWMTFVATFHCSTCHFPFEETVDKVTVLSSPEPVGLGEDARARGTAIKLIKQGWSKRVVGLRLSQELQSDYFIMQGWTECHKTLKSFPGRKQISNSQVSKILQRDSSWEYLRSLSLRP